MEARIKAACDHVAAEAINPRNPVMREFNRLSAEARRDGCNLDLAGGLELARRLAGLADSLEQTSTAADREADAMRARWQANSEAYFAKRDQDLAA
jgi:hypothetical protein